VESQQVRAKRKTARFIRKDSDLKIIATHLLGGGFATSPDVPAAGRLLSV